MKKTLLTIAIVFGIVFCATAQNRGLFDLGPSSGYDNDYYGFNDGTNGVFSLPTFHGNDQDVEAPLGSGMAVLLGLGGAYLLTKRRKE